MSDKLKPDTHNPVVGVLIVTHNAPRYCWKALRSLRKTRDVSTRVVVVDNDSRLLTRLVLMTAAFFHFINRLTLLDRNTFFAEGCNTAARLVPVDVTHLLLLNSDVSIRDPLWLHKLLKEHQRGATAYGYVDDGAISRADGYCFLVDRDIYELYGGLDEQFQWWWAVTRFQTQLLQDGLSVRAVADHDHLVVHFGGKSGKAWKAAKGMDTDRELVKSWFPVDRQVEKISVK